MASSLINCDDPYLTKMATVMGLNVFPIKSCSAVRVEELRVDSYGVVDDRRFMLIDAGNSRFVSQRKFPKLATVSSKFTTNGRGERLLHVSCPEMKRDLEFSPISLGERVEVSVWEDKVLVVDQGESPAQWFSELIGHGGAFIRLVSSAESHDVVSDNPKTGVGVAPTDSAGSGTGNPEPFHRTVTNLPPGLKGRLPDMKLALSDAGPVSLVSMESLGDVNGRLRERGCDEVPLNRFRMNIEISGCSKPFEEDDWLLVRIGNVPFLSYTNAQVYMSHSL